MSNGEPGRNVESNPLKQLGITGGRPSSVYQYTKRLTPVYRWRLKSASECYHLQPLSVSVPRLLETKKEN